MNFEKRDSELLEKAHSTAKKLSADIYKTIRDNPLRFSNVERLGFYLETIAPDLSSAELTGEIQLRMLDEPFTSRLVVCPPFSIDTVDVENMSDCCCGLTWNDAALLVEALEVLGYNCFIIPPNRFKKLSRLLIAFEVSC